MNLKTVSPALAAIFLITGCAYPRIVTYYDEECQINARKMILDAADLRAAKSCSNQNCLADIAFDAAVLTSTAIVSGSIVLVGNAVLWKERNKKCKRGEPYVQPPQESTAPAQT